jgi:hypothetical protein
MLACIHADVDVGARALACLRACSLYYPACATILPSTASLAPPNVSTFSHKRYDLRKNVTEHDVCFDFSYNFCLKHFSF